MKKVLETTELITITLTKKEAAKALDDLEELARHFDLETFFESKNNVIQKLIKTLECHE